MPLGQPVGRDALAGAMLTQLLKQQGLAAKNALGKLSAGELLDLVEKSDVGAACISVVSPSTVIQARYLCAKLRVRFPQLKIVIGLWGTTEGLTDAARRLRDSGANATLNDAVLQLSADVDAIATAEQKVADLKAQIDAERDLSTSLDFDEVGSTRHGT